MATISLNSSTILCSYDYQHDLQLQFSHSNNLRVSRILSRTWVWPRIQTSRHNPYRLFCQSKAEEIQIRKCAEFLEGGLYQSSKNALTSSDDWKAVPDIWRSSSEKYGDRVALVDPYHDPPSNITYKQLEQEILDFAEGLRLIGVKPEEKLSLFADNSCRWLVADQGIMATGAINVVRGSRDSAKELMHIYTHSESVALAVDNPEFVNRIAETFSSNTIMKFVIILWGDKSSVATEKIKGIPVFSYKEIIEMGRQNHRAPSDSHDDAGGNKCIRKTINSNDVATIMYTSGTTGNPKGVMLTHKNLLYQIRNLWDVLPVKAGDRFVNMLPPWHAYERACEYFILSHGVEIVYSTMRNLKDDLQHYQPHYMVSVPLVYETLYRGVQKQISTSSAARRVVALALISVSLKYMQLKRIYEGLCLTSNQKQPSHLVSTVDWFWARIVSAVLWPVHMLANMFVYAKFRAAIGISKAGISGGGSLPMHIDQFYEVIGIRVQNAYGLTELSPAAAVRRPTCNVLGSVGHALNLTELKIVDAETNEVLPPGSKGIVKVRGPQVMKGYYKNPSATKRALDEDGWLGTGDIGWIAPHHSRGRSRRCGGLLVLEGRAKDTIVLSTGENVEPVELEEAALRSSLIQQIVVVGQDQRRLGALIVPNKDEILMEAKRLSMVDTNASEINKEAMTSLLYNELKKWTSECSFQIGPILTVDEPFTIDNGLMTPTMKIRRERVVARYKDEIVSLYK